VAISAAINAARDAYESALSNEDFDPAHFPMDITVHCLNLEFNEVLHTIDDVEWTVAK